MGRGISTTRYSFTRVGVSLHDLNYLCLLDRMIKNTKIERMLVVAF